MSVCIDRTNFNALQRSHWIEIASEFPGTLIWLIVFDVPYETCVARLRERTSHPTIKSTEQGLSVLARFAAEFEHPRPDEGYERIIYLKASDHLGPIYSRSDVSAILRRVWDSVPVTPTGIPRSLQTQHFYSQQSNRRDLTRDDMRSSSRYHHNENGMFAAERPIHGWPARIGAPPGTRERTNERQGGHRHLWHVTPNNTVYRPG